ncbi:MAG TPA: PQQ-dependent sugar dehydrogenase, partial [Bacteroidia bacterium]|nr:PQQ-dependent sugar dehydrogenase [Bacteroidia bacterium]
IYSMNNALKTSYCKYRIYVISLILFNFIGINYVYSQTYPSGFTQVAVASGLSSPTNFAFAPDGRIFICEKAGKIKILKNGILLSTPFLSLNVNNAGERGLLGIAFDPNFTTNKYVYVYYTISAATNNRVSRFTASGDIAISNSEVIVRTMDALSSATNHNGGTIKFGPDGKLYVAVGENTNSTASQSLTTTMGKMLRMNSDGTPAVGNPFYSSTNAQKKLIWCYGLRNPYSFDFDSNTGKLFINDVGSNSSEEINDGTNGNLNFGWPNVEGISGNAAYTDPVFAYAHGVTNTTGCAITGGAFFNSSISNYPAAYANKYFYIDYCNQWISYINVSSQSNSTVFATGISDEMVCIDQGKDGNLYFLSRIANKLYKISYNNITVPTIISQPVGLSVSLGQPASFSVVASGSTPLTYVWKKNGVSIANSNSAIYTINKVTSNSAGTYSCYITNSFGSVTSTGAVLVVTAFNAAPVATIITPTNNTLYSGGMTVNYSGTATDAEDGNIASANFLWEIRFFHDTHNHPGPLAVAGAKSGSFNIPNVGETSENVFYRIYLYVKDSKGLYDTAFVDLIPKTSIIGINSTPQGLQIKVDGQTYTTPVNIVSVEGIWREIIPVSPQTTNNGVTYDFVSWSNGSSKILSVQTPVNDISYTATFSTTLRTPENPQYSVSGMHYEYFEGSWNSLPDFTLLLPKKEGNAANIDLTYKEVNDNFAFNFTGYIEIPTDGNYTFYCNSDDGSRLYIGNSLVVDNDGLHSKYEASGTIGLKAGKHAMRVEYFEATGSEIFTVSYSGPGITKQIIPSASLFQDAVLYELVPIADSYIRSGSYANQTFGTTDELNLLVKKSKSTSNSLRVSYLKFDISGIDNAIISAKLKLNGYLNAPYPGGVTVGVWKTPNTYWNENLITFNNAPALPSNMINSTIVNATTPVDYFWDVASYLDERRSGGYDKMTLAMANVFISSTSTVQFNSKEAPSDIPKLFVLLNPNLLAFAKTENNYSLIESDILIYPVPANEECMVQLKINLADEYQYTITSLKGEIIAKQNVSGNIFTIPTSSFDNGIYILTIQTTKGIIHKKFQVMH